MPLHLFFLSIFSLNLIILFFVKPIGNNIKIKHDSSKFELPQVTFKDFKIFDVGDNSIVKSTLSGSFGEGYRDGSYKIKDVELKYKSSKFVEKITGNRAFYTQSNIEISGDILYKRSDKSSIKTDKLSYDFSGNYFYIPSHFIFQRKGTIIKGQTLTILRDVGRISAFNVSAILNKRAE